MDKGKKKRLLIRLLTLGALILTVIVTFVLANIPVVAEYFFARGITRGLGFLFSRATNYIPVSFYEWTAVLLIAGGITLLVFLVVLLCRKKICAGGRLSLSPRGGRSVRPSGVRGALCAFV